MDDKDITQRAAPTFAMLMAAGKRPATDRDIAKATKADRLRMARIMGQRRGRP